MDSARAPQVKTYAWCDRSSGAHHRHRTASSSSSPWNPSPSFRSVARSLGSPPSPSHRVSWPPSPPLLAVVGREAVIVSRRKTTCGEFVTRESRLRVQDGYLGQAEEELQQWDSQPMPARGWVPLAENFRPSRWGFRGASLLVWLCSIVPFCRVFQLKLWSLLHLGTLLSIV